MGPALLNRGVSGVPRVVGVELAASGLFLCRCFDPLPSIMLTSERERQLQENRAALEQAQLLGKERTGSKSSSSFSRRLSFMLCGQDGIDWYDSRFCTGATQQSRNISRAEAMPCIVVTPDTIGTN